METLVRGAGKEVVFGPDRPRIIIGNRIDPQADAKIAEAFKSMDLGPLAEAARLQASQGADLIGVRAAGPGIDEAKALPEAVKAVARAVDLPLCITTREAGPLKAALEVCPGKPLVNAATAEDKSTSEMLPLVLAWEAAVITVGYDPKGLPYEFKGLPFQFDVSFELHRIAMRKALSTGVARENVVVGIHAPALAQDPQSAAYALNLAAEMARLEQLSVALEPGIITQGLEEAELVQQTLAAASMLRGVNIVIGDPLVLRPTVRAADRLFPCRGGAGAD